MKRDLHVRLLAALWVLFRRRPRAPGGTPAPPVVIDDPPDSPTDAARTSDLFAVLEGKKWETDARMREWEDRRAAERAMFAE